MLTVPLAIQTEIQGHEGEVYRRKRFSRKCITKKIGSCIIHHESVFKVTWDWIVLALVLYTAIEIPFAIAFHTRERPSKGVWKKISSGEPREIVNFLVDIMFIVDILINFRTTYEGKKSELTISEPKKIAIHYLKTWFVVDFVAAIPFDFFIPRKAEGAASLAGLLKTARLLRLIRVSRKMDRYSEFGLAVVFLLTSLFMLIAHWLACLWNVIGEKEIEVPYGWVQLLGDTVGQPVNQSVPGSGPGTGSRYITALYFTITSLTSIGFGNVAPNTDNEKSFAVVMMLLGALFYAVIFGNLTAIIQRLYSSSARYHRDVRVVNDCIALHDFPQSLQRTLREFFTNEQSATRGDDIESIMYHFPETLQADIRVHLNHSLFEQFPEIFDDVSEACLRALASVFRVEVFPRLCYLLKEGDQVTKLYFIVSGSVDVLQGEQSKMNLEPGHVAGCNMTIRRRRPGHFFKSHVSLVAKVSTQVHLIAWKDLMQVMKVYPEIKERFMEDMELSCNLASSDMKDNVFNEEDEQQDHIHLLNMSSPDDHVITAPRRRRADTWGDHPDIRETDNTSDQQTDEGSVMLDKWHLEKLETKISYMEDALSEILVLLKKKDRDNPKTQPANSMFSSTSYV